MSDSFLTNHEISLLGLKSYGDQLRISRYARFYNAAEMSIGNNVRIDDFCILSGRITLGNNIHISAHCSFYGGAGITIGDYAGTSPGCTIFSVSDDFSGEYLVGPMVDNALRNVHSAPVSIGNFAQIGAGCVVLPGVTLDDGVAVGSMSLIVKSLEAWGIYAGVPAKFIKPRSKRMLDLIPKV